MTPANAPPGNEPAEPQVNVFALELRRWRDVRGLSRSALAAKLGYSRPYVSKIESGTEKPSREFAACAESALQTGGASRSAFTEFTAKQAVNRLSHTGHRPNNQHNRVFVGRPR